MHFLSNVERLTFIPDSNNSFTIPAPIPELAPVTIATLSFKVLIITAIEGCMFTEYDLNTIYLFRRNYLDQQYTLTKCEITVSTIINLSHCNNLSDIANLG